MMITSTHQGGNPRTVGDRSFTPPCPLPTKPPSREAPFPQPHPIVTSETGANSGLKSPDSGLLAVLESP